MKFFRNILLISLFCSPVAAQVMAPSSEGLTRIPGPACEDGIILDDGTMETAYGWVPSAIWGEYVQLFSREAMSSTILDSICVCWTRTREDDSLDFEIVVYRQGPDAPGATPYMTIPAHVDGVPRYGEGRFYEISTAEFSRTLPAGDWSVGVRWNPSVDQFFFLCADQSPSDQPVPGFFRDDRADGEWGSVLETTDPMFQAHRAMMLRPRPVRVGWVPTLGRLGVLAMVFFMASAGLFFLRQR